MESKATARFVRIAPRKARIIADMIRGKYADEALEQLRFTPRRGAPIVGKVLKSAVANALAKSADEKKLVVEATFVDKGPTLRRFRPRARGMASRINKMTSHITVVVAERD